MYDKIIKEWEGAAVSFRHAATLSLGPVAGVLKAQAEGYGLALRSFEPLDKDHEGAKLLVEELCSCVCVLKDAASIVPKNEKELTTIAGTVSVCIKTLREAIPQEVENETPNNT